MKVTINKETCIKCGLCQSIDPEVFEVADGNPSTLLNEEPDFLDAHSDNIHSAVDQCPVHAIDIIEGGVSVEEESENPSEEMNEPMADPTVEEPMGVAENEEEMPMAA